VVHRLRSPGSAVHPLTTSGLASAGPFFDPFDLLPMKQITYKLESHYGRTRAYPVDQEAILFCQLTQSKTLTAGSVGTIKGLGFLPVDRDGFEIDPRELY